MASEVLKVKLIKELSNTEVDLLAVTSAHTFTVLNISICETAGAAETFEHTSRIVLMTTDVLSAKLGSTGNVDVVISYLDQTL